MAIIQFLVIKDGYQYKIRQVYILDSVICITIILYSLEPFTVATAKVWQ